MGVLYYKQLDGTVVAIGSGAAPTPAAQVAWTANNAVANSAVTVDVGALLPVAAAAGFVVITMFSMASSGVSLTCEHNAYSNRYSQPSPPAGTGWGVKGVSVSVPANLWTPLAEVVLASPVSVGQKPDVFSRVNYTGPNCFVRGFAVAAYYSGTWTTP